MNSLIVHGCYDSQTLRTLIDIGIKEFAFDLRGRSPNLIPFKDLNSLVGLLPSKRVFLTCENDRRETILSFLNLLKVHPVDFTLIFRDQQEASYYHGLGTPFLWMFHPTSDWRAILSVPELKGVLLPVKWQSHYQNLPELWRIIDGKNLEVFLHADNFDEASELKLQDELNFSLDLGPEIESSYRNVDQAKLKNMKVWRKINESLTR